MSIKVSQSSYDPVTGRAIGNGSGKMGNPATGSAMGKGINFGDDRFVAERSGKVPARSRTGYPSANFDSDSSRHFEAWMHSGWQFQAADQPSERA